MPNREIHLESLLGTCVLDTQGESIGRIEEVRAEQQGDEWVIVEYHVGTAALLERFSALNIGLAILRLLGAQKFGGGLRVPWDKLDLSDPKKPRLLCSVAECKKLQAEAEESEKA